MVHGHLSVVDRVYLFKLHYSYLWCLLSYLDSWLQTLIRSRSKTHVVYIWRQLRWYDYTFIFISCFPRYSTRSILRVSGWYVCSEIKPLFINRFNDTPYHRTRIVDASFCKKAKINLFNWFDTTSFSNTTIFIATWSEQRKKSFFSLFESFLLLLISSECIRKILISLISVSFRIIWLGLQPI